MKRVKSTYCLLPLLFFLAAGGSHAQSIYEKYDIYRNPARVFLNKFSITVTTGYASTNYKHDLSGVYFFQDVQNQFVFNNSEEILGSSITGYSDWFNAPQLGFETSLENPFDVPFDYLENPVNNPLLGDGQFLINTDTAALGFEGRSWGIPLSLNIHYSFEDFRIGGGFTYEKQFIKELTPTSFQGEVRSYQPNFKSTHYKRLYGLLGYKFYSFWSYDFVAELQLGSISAGKQFSKADISRGLYTNVGISIENNWSEYFRVVIRPSVDFKKYTVDLPDGSSIDHRHPSFMISVGISINYPDIPRAPMTSDHVQLKHVYADPSTGKYMEVRGQPIWKRQNPKAGENHRTIRKHKPSSRGKIKSDKSKSGKSKKGFWRKKN